MSAFDFSNLAWAWGAGAGYKLADEDLQRILKIYDLSSNKNDAEQTTAADQPILSRDDDKQNLVTHSRLPGTLGATSPDGWTSADFGTGSPAGEIVASDDGADSHQAFNIPALTDARRFLQQSQEVVEGMILIVACKVELNNWTGGVDRVVHVAGPSVVTGSGKDLSTLVNGEWGFRKITIASTGTGFFRFGVGPSSPASSDGDIRISRPVVAHAPDDWDSKSDAEKQQWLTDHYAASGTDHQEFAGYRNMRGIIVPDHAGKHLMGPTINPGGDGWTEFSLAVFTVPRVFPGVNQVVFSDSGREGLFWGSGNAAVFRWKDAAASIYQAVSATPVVNTPYLWTATAKVGEPLRFYTDDTLDDSSSAIPSFQDFARTLQISDGTLPYAGDVFYAFVWKKQLALAEISDLNKFCRGTL